MSRSTSVRSWACCAISAPWSQVSDFRSCLGSVVIDAAMASGTASVAVAGERRTVFGLLLFAVAWHGWEVSQHREPGGALHKGPDRGAPKSDDQVTFPVAWHCPVVGLGGALADHDLGADELVAPLPGPYSWNPAMLARFAHTPRVRVLAHPCLAHIAPGRSLRERFALTHYRAKSTRSRFEICSGLHAVAHRRSFRGP